MTVVRQVIVSTFNEISVAKLPSIPKALMDLFLTCPMTGKSINAAGVGFQTALIEASLNAELSHHLGYAPASDKPSQITNHCNASTAKAVLTEDGKVLIATPRDREGYSRRGAEPKFESGHRPTLCAPESAT